MNNASREYLKDNTTSSGLSPPEIAMKGDASLMMNLGSGLGPNRDSGFGSVNDFYSNINSQPN